MGRRLAPFVVVIGVPDQRIMVGSAGHLRRGTDSRARPYPGHQHAWHVDL